MIPVGTDCEVNKQDARRPGLKGKRSSTVAIDKSLQGNHVRKLGYRYRDRACCHVRRSEPGLHGHQRIHRDLDGLSVTETTLDLRGKSVPVWSTKCLRVSVLSGE